MNKKITAVLDFKQFRVGDGKYELIARVYDLGLITLHTRQGNKEFRFVGSKKETITAIADIMKKACEL